MRPCWLCHKPDASVFDFCDADMQLLLCSCCAAEVRRRRKEAFDKHLKRASEIVATWPEWKRKVLG